MGKIQSSYCSRTDRIEHALVQIRDQRQSSRGEVEKKLPAAAQDDEGLSDDNHHGP